MIELENITCCGCDKTMTDEQLKDGDGFCVYCGSEIEDMEND